MNNIELQNFSAVENTQTQQQTSFITSCLHKIQEKIDAIFTYLAFGNQLAQLEGMEKTMPFEVIQRKKESLLAHIKTVSTFEKFTLSLKLLVRKINFIRTLILRFALHPATYSYSFDIMKVHGFEMDRYNTGLLTYHIFNPPSITPCLNIYTKDHQQIDGKLFRPYNANENEKRPVFVMSAGNAMCYEECISQAKSIAEQNHVDVLLYNPRGVGLSLGAEYNTDEAVEDCKAVIKYALENLCENKDPSKLGVFGLSLGGGITASALTELQDEKVIDTVGLYVNCDSFPSIQHCLKGMLGTPTLIGRIALGLLGLNPLDGAQNIATRKLAKKTLVITADDDQVMKGEGRLVNFLKAQKIENDIAKDIEYHHDENAMHGMYSIEKVQQVIDQTLKTTKTATVA